MIAWAASLGPKRGPDEVWISLTISVLLKNSVMPSEQMIKYLSAYRPG